MTYKTIFLMVVSVFLFTFSLILYGINHNTAIFTGRESFIDMVCLNLFASSSIVFLLKGIARVKEKENNQPKNSTLT